MLEVSLKEAAHDHLNMEEEERARIYKWATRPDVKKEQLPMIRRTIFEMFTHNIGFVCSSERKDSLLMWAHYARNHEGFVIGFDIEFWGVSQGGDRAVSSNGHLRQVIYVENRPDRHKWRQTLQEIVFRRVLRGIQGRSTL
jgi:hypothetical protein